MPDLQTDIRYIKGVGEQRAKALARLGIRTLGDLLNYFPRTYEDRTALRTLEEVLPEDTACIRAMVATEPRLSHVRRGMDLVKLRIVDETGSADVTYFNQSYVRDQLKKGETYIFYGKVGGSILRKTLTNPVYERVDRAGVTTGRILPVYRLTHGISNKLLITAIESALDECGDILPELLPGDVTEKYRLPRAGFAYRCAHFPRTGPRWPWRRRRLIYEELFVLSCAMHLLRAKRERAAGQRMEKPDMGEYYASLPYSPTAAQRRRWRRLWRIWLRESACPGSSRATWAAARTLVAAAFYGAFGRAGTRGPSWRPRRFWPSSILPPSPPFWSPWACAWGC
jgi:ATP-dependent DNA helicase RecG